MSVYDFDVAIEPTFLDFLGVGAGYGVLSVPVSDFLDGDVVNSATINITPVNGVGDTITKSVDMVQRTDGYFEWVTSASISAHFTLEADDVNTIAAGDYEYSVSVTATRNGVARAREVQGGAIQCRDSNAGVALIVSSIVVSPSTVTGDSGDTAQLTAVAYDGNGDVIAGQVFDWTSSNPTVATVDATGLVSFLIPGDSTITAAAQGIQDTATATSTDPGYGGATNKQVAGYLTVGGWAPRSLDFTWLGGVATVAQGGTGVASVTAGSLLLGAGTSAFTELAHGATGLAVISNGSTFTARAIVTADISDLTTALTGITKVGTVGVGTWQGSSIATTYTDAKLKTLAGTSSRITIGGTATDPTVDISAGYVGQTSITTLGTVATGVWQGTAIADAYLAALDAAKLTGTVASARLSGSYTGITAVGTLGSLAVTAGVTIGTTLGVTGATTLTDLTVSGTFTFSGTSISVSTLNATNVNATTIAVTTLSVTGNQNIVGDFSVNTNKFTVAGASGNTAVAGTLAVTGASTVAAVTASGLITANSGLTVASGTTSTQALSSTTGLFSSTVTVSSGGIAVTGASTITGTLGGITTLTATTLAGTLSTASQPNVTTMAGLVSVGTIATGTWNATVITTTYGGTGLASYTAGDLTYYASGTTFTKLAIGAANRVLTSTGSAPQWVAGLSITTLSLSSTLTMTASASVLIPGATSFAIRNNGDSANNLLVNDAGDVTVRNGFTVTAGGMTVSSGTSAFQAVTATTYVGSSTGQFGGTLTVTTGGVTVTGASTITGTLGGITTLSATTVTATTLNGTLGTAAQPNVTSVGTLTSLAVGAITSTGLIQTTLTSEQLRLRYDASNYLSHTVASDGAATYDAVGSGASHTFTDPLRVTSASATAVAVGPAGTTNPVWLIDASTASQAAGLQLTGATSAGTVALAVISSGSNANLSVNAKGSGTIAIGSVSTGAVTITPATTLSNGATITTGGFTVSAGTTAVQALTTTTINASGNITGTLATAAQPNVTSVGTLTSVTVSGAINAGNVVKFTDNALGTAATYWVGAANTTRLYFNVPTGSGFEFLTNNTGSISMVAGVLTVPSGLTVSAGTTAVQALTATTAYVGTTTNYGRQSQPFVLSAAAAFGGMSINTWSATASEAPLIDMQRSKSATPGTYTAVGNGDVLGYLVWRGANGSAMLDAGYIKVTATGAPSTNVPGKFEFITHDGTTAVAALTLSSAASVVVGSAAIATNATDGFLYIPSCAGAPSGTPTAFTGRIPLVYDSTNNFLYVYNGGWKKSTVYA